MPAHTVAMGHEEGAESMERIGRDMDGRPYKVDSEPWGVCHRCGEYIWTPSDARYPRRDGGAICPDCDDVASFEWARATFRGVAL